MVDFVVQYETVNPERIDEHVAVVRYDGNHGRAHRDLLDVTGRTVRKTWLASRLTLAEALDEALVDIEAHWARYRERFFR